MTTTDLSARLWIARRDGDVLDISDSEVPADVAASYGVQASAVAESGESRIGWKVGSTSHEAQRLLGTDGPGAAPLLQRYCYTSGSAIPVFSAHQPGLEGEFALRFTRPLPAQSESYTPEEVLDAINAVAPALEVVGSRRVGGLFGQGRLLVNADFGANIAFANGDWIADWRAHDLAAAPVKLYIDDELKAEGTGERALGSPLNVAVWLANHLSERGIGIRAGDIVSTGTCTGVVATKPGQSVRLDFAALGTLTVQIIAG